MISWNCRISRITCCWLRTNRRLHVPRENPIDDSPQSDVACPFSRRRSPKRDETDGRVVPTAVRQGADVSCYGKTPAMRSVPHIRYRPQAGVDNS